MIQTGVPAMFGVTYTQTPAFVAARVFDATNSPVGAWVGCSNYDGFSWQVPITFSLTGAFSVKIVAFTDSGFTTRDPNFAEADNAIQVTNASGGGGGSTTVIGSTLEGEVVPPDTEVIG